MQEWKMQEYTAWMENAGVNSMDGKCRREKCRSDDRWRAISIGNYKIPVV